MTKADGLLRIPLLKDVFERYPTTPINIDVKENNDELIRQVIIPYPIYGYSLQMSDNRKCIKITFEYDIYRNND